MVYHLKIAIVLWIKEAAYSTYKKLRHTIQMTNDRPVYILPLVDINVYWPNILYSMTSWALYGTLSYLENLISLIVLL